jgi:pimeloyl-ACP methyl ester carboxylesterase
MAFTQHMSTRLHYILTPQSSPSKELAVERVQSDSSVPVSVSVGSKYTLLIHGLFFGNLAGWFPTITQHLSQHSNVLCYDLRGHGLSAITPQGYTLKQQLIDLSDLLTELGWGHQPISVIGHSFGGRLALELALRSHFTIDQIILIDSPISQHDGEELMSEVKLWSQQGQDELWSMLPAQVGEMINRGGRRAQRLLKRWYTLLNKTTLISDLERSPFPTHQELATLSEHIWALYGGQSGCQSSWRQLYGLIPQSQGHTLPMGGHFLLNEAPQEVIHFIDRALAPSHEESVSLDDHSRQEP